MNRDELIDSLVPAIASHDEVMAVALNGSLARGLPDEHSDLDIEVVVADERLRSFIDDLPGIIRSACDPVLIKVGPFVTNVVTRDWLRADVVVRAGSEARRAGDADATPVFDPHAPLRVVEEFMRSLGLLPAAAARGEWVGAYIATGFLTRLLTELMEFENGTHRVGGALRLSERLTPDQRDAIAAIPPLIPTKEAVMAAQTQLAREFLERARRLSDSLGFDYPVELETALVQHLERHGIDLRLDAMPHAKFTNAPTGDPAFYAALPTKHVAAGCVFVDEEGAVLLVKPTYKDSWELPGGAVEADESPLDGCRREIEEELGIRCQPGPLLTVDYRPTVDGVRSDALRFVFDGGRLDEADLAGAPIPSEELSEWRFVHPGDLHQFLIPAAAGRVTAALSGDVTLRYVEDGARPR